MKTFWSTANASFSEEERCDFNRWRSNIYHEAELAFDLLKSTGFVPAEQIKALMDLIREAPYLFPATEPEEEVWSDRLFAPWRAWSVVAPGHLALQMPPRCCCDMAGAIRVAKVLMPEVRQISTYAGAKEDTLYLRRGRKWTAYEPEPAP